jgi:hypothetical protein
MSDTAFASDADEINIQGTALDPAEPVTTEFESETQAEPDEHLAALEAQPGDYLAGFKHAADELGAVIEFEPGQEGYVEYAQSQIEELQQERAAMLSAVNTVAEQAIAQGNTELAEYAIAAAESLNAQVQEVEWERQAQAEERAYEWQAAVSEGEQRIDEWTQQTAADVGVEPESIDSARVWEIAADAYGRLIESHGQEVADQLVPELIERTVAFQSDETEAGMQQAFETAEKLVKDLGGKADPTEVTRIASDVYGRALYRSGGDHTEALRASMLEGAKIAAGFSETSQPLNMVSVASLHASLNRAIPRDPEPQLKHELQLPRDQNGRFVPRTNVAADHAAKPPKSDAERVADAQKEALKNAFAALGGNAANR